LRAVAVASGVCGTRRGAVDVAVRVAVAETVGDGVASVPEYGLRRRRCVAMRVGLGVGVAVGDCVPWRSRRGLVRDAVAVAVVGGCCRCRGGGRSGVLVASASRC